MSSNENLQQLSQLIQQSLSGNQEARQQAEAHVAKLRLDGATTGTILEFISKGQDFGEQQTLMAAIWVKNIIKRVYGQHNFTHYNEQKTDFVVGSEDDPNYWMDRDGASILQQNLVPLLLDSPSKISRIFLEIIALMGKKYVMSEWPDLVPRLKDCLNSNDPNHRRLALEAIKKICKKYRYMFRSDDLYTEMNYMIENVSSLLMQNLVTCVEQLKQPIDDSNTVNILLGIINSVLHIIESILSQEELPDFYEENLPTISEACIFILELQFNSPEQPDLLFKARAKVVRLVHLYSFKFGDLFQDYANPFFQKIWEMVAAGKVQATKQSERLVQATVRYLKEMTLIANYADFFKQNLQTLFQVLIIPNISITENDVEEYEFEPQTYIKNDLEESDVETRRYQCMKFVQSLSKKFPEELNGLMSQLISQLAAEYRANRDQEWAKMTTLLNLIVTAGIGAYTYRHGASDLNISQDMLLQYLEQLVIPELQEQKIDNLPLLKATAIKFVHMFRNQIPDQFVPIFVTHLSEFLKSEQMVNKSYAAACIEKLLIRKSLNNQNQMIFTQQTIDKDLISKLLQNLCELLNDIKDLYAIRALFRVIQLSGNNLVPFAATMGQVLGAFIGEAAKDEANASPNYTYILFEAAALTLKYVKNDLQAFNSVENQITQPLNAIIQQNNIDLSGFAFQLYSVFVATNTEMKDNYKMLVQSILENIQNWGKEMKYLVPAEGQFLVAVIHKHSDFIKSQPQYIERIQDIVNHLLSPEIRNEKVALQISSALFEKADANEQFLNKVLLSIFGSLHFYRNNTKTKVIPTVIMQSVLQFFANFMIFTNGPDHLLRACDQIQPSVLFMVLKSEGDKIKHLAKGVNHRDPKYAVKAFTGLIVSHCENIEPEVTKVMMSSLLDLVMSNGKPGFQVASALTMDTEDLLEDSAIDKTFAFSRQSYVALNSAKIELTDWLEKVQPDVCLMEGLQQICAKLKISARELLVDTEKHGQALQQLCNQTNMSIS